MQAPKIENAKRDNPLAKAIFFPNNSAPEKARRANTTITAKKSKNKIRSVFLFRSGAIIDPKKIKPAAFKTGVSILSTIVVLGDRKRNIV